LEVTVDTRKDTVPRISLDSNIHLAWLEEKYRHEILGQEERCELRDHILRIKRGAKIARILGR
jgi:hypothetical protein